MQQKKEPDRTPYRLSFTEQSLRDIANGSLNGLTIDSKEFDNGLIIDITEAKVIKETHIEIKWFQTLFICHCTSMYKRATNLSRTENQRLTSLRFARTFENFNAFKKFQLRELNTSDRHTAENRLSKVQKTAMLYVAWMLIPKWAKNKDAYYEKWGFLGRDLPSFYNPENHIPEFPKN